MDHLELLHLISNAEFDRHPMKYWNVDKVKIKKTPVKCLVTPRTLIVLASARIIKYLEFGSVKKGDTSPNK